MNPGTRDSDMNTDYRGLIDSERVSNGLIPLFEAIMNSIHAIEDAESSDGQITIEVLRNQPLMESMDTDIYGFRITDNGVGFHDKNYKAFDTVHTKYKAKRGGKGFGRISWLRVFDRAEVESVFVRDGQFLKRHFIFMYRDEPIERQRDDNQTTDAQATETTVTLNTFRSFGGRDTYASCKRYRSETIAKKIIEHFFQQFHNPCFPRILLVDRDVTIDLNQKLNQHMDSEPIRSFGVGGQDTHIKQFWIEHVKIRQKFLDEQSIYFCAHGRVVRVEKASKMIPNIPKRFSDDRGDFTYAAFVRAGFLDASVNAARTEFTIPESIDGELLDGEISWKSILRSAESACQTFLSEYLCPLRQEREKKIRDFLARKREYVGISRYAQPELEKLPYSCTEKDIKKALDTAAIELEENTLSWVDFSGQGLEAWGLEGFLERFNEQIEKIDALRGFNLSRYVMQRKFILDALEYFVQRIDEEKAFSPERKVHQIIFPLKKSTDDICLGDSNIWLIDEKLIPYSYVASDIPLTKIPEVESDSKSRPDLIAFHSANAFVIGSEMASVHPSVVIVEFKRPQRDDYRAGVKGSDPLSQILGYIQDLKSQKAKTKSGRSLPSNEDTRFYCYIIADVTPSLKSLLLDHDFRKTYDGESFYKIHAVYNAYIEVISYSKLIEDARKRNQAFFEKLGLESTQSYFARNEATD